MLLIRGYLRRSQAENPLIPLSEFARPALYIWPIVELQVKYVRPVRYAQRIRVEARLAEYENRLKITYICRDEETGGIVTKAHTVQLAVDIKTQELSLESPSVFLNKVREALRA